MHHDMMHGCTTIGLTTEAPTPNRPLGRVLLLTGSIGSGHTRAAEALCEAMLRSGAARTTHVIDVLSHARISFRALYRDAYLSLIERAPATVGWIYRTSDSTEGGRARRVLQRWALASLRKLIAREQPETIVCTHFLAAEVVSGMVARGEWRGTLGVVVTDLDAHAMWAVCPNADRWFVAINETREILAGKGVPRERISVTGIPIAGAFSARQVARTEMRTRLGLAPDAPVLLVSGGGVGISGLGPTLTRLLDMDLPCGIALVCGKNARLRAESERIVAARAPNRVRCVVFGFTHKMHELMHAADLAVGKPGGLTSSEALACGLPMAILNPVPGQEERNADHLLEWGVAVRLNSPESIGWRLASLLSDTERLRQMRAAARMRARPFAADTIVEELCATRRDGCESTPRLALVPTRSLEERGGELMHRE